VDAAGCVTIILPTLLRKGFGLASSIVCQPGQVERGHLDCTHECHGSGAALQPLRREMTMATESGLKDYAHSEGQVAKTIEKQTAKLPSDAFLWMAVGSMAVSATMQMVGKKHASVFVGQWAPTFLIFGLYNKLVKQLGSDRTENAV
jgi:hypothetical protein